MESRHGSAKYCSPACGQAEKGAAYYSRNAEALRAKARAKAASIPAEVRVLKRIEGRARRAGLEFNLTADDCIAPEVCPVLGVQLFSTSSKTWNGHAPSVDRISPLKGYVKGNVRVISARANLLKSNATELEMSAVLADLRRISRRASPTN